MHGESSETKHPASLRKKKNARALQKERLASANTCASAIRPQSSLRLAFASQTHPRRSNAFDVNSFLTRSDFTLLAQSQDTLLGAFCSTLHGQELIFRVAIHLLQSHAITSIPQSGGRCRAETTRPSLSQASPKLTSYP